MRRLFIDIFYLERIESKNVVVKLPKNLYIGEYSRSSRNLKNCEEKTLITLYIKYKPQLRSQSFHKGGGAKVHLLALYMYCTIHCSFFKVQQCKAYPEKYVHLF
jgi:hypothetical protein